MIDRSKKLLSVSLLALVIGAAPAWAAQPADDGAAAASSAAGADKVEEIVVTAQFREQNLQKTPIAITAITGSMLAARSQTNIAQIAAQAPSVNLQPSNQIFGPSMAASIRGVGQYDYSPAVEPGVGLYVDDVYYATLTGSIFDLLDLDRVEVLRGPQGTLAGRNSIGGAIKLYSKRPTGSGEGMLQATYGSRNRIDLRASADFHLAPALDMRIAGVAKRQTGYVKDYDFGCLNPPGSANNPGVGGVAPTIRGGSSCLLGHYGSVNYQATRVQLRYHPSDVVDINIIGDYTHEQHSPAAAVLTYADNASPGVRGAATNVPFDSRFICGKYCNYATGISPADPANGLPYATSRQPDTRYDGYGFSGEGEFRLTDDLKLTSITAYRHYSASFGSDDDVSPLAVSNSYNQIYFRFFSQELRLNGSFADDHILYTVGGYYSSQKTAYPLVQDIRWAGLQFSSLGDIVPAHSKAAFANASWDVIGGLTLNGGIRYTAEDKDYTYSRRNADGTAGQPLVGPLDGLTGHYSRKRVDYRANLQYQWTPDIMTYAQFSTGFKGGGINPRPYFPSQVQPFGPEKLNAYEIGLKSDLLDHKARVNISAFYSQYDSIQLTLLSCPQFNPEGVPPTVLGLPCAMTANAGDAHLKGIELETSLRPIAGFLIDGSFSYLDFKYTSINPAAGGPGGVQLSDVAPFSSKWKWSIGAQYAIPLPAGSTLTPRIDASYQSSFYTGAVNVPTGKVNGYTIANARITWRNAHKDLEISGEVTNLFDKYYMLNLFDEAGPGGYVVGEPARPREWALTVTKHF